MHRGLLDGTAEPTGVHWGPRAGIRMPQTHGDSVGYVRHWRPIRTMSSLSTKDHFYSSDEKQLMKTSHGQFVNTVLRTR